MVKEVNTFNSFWINLNDDHTETWKEMPKTDGVLDNYWVECIAAEDFPSFPEGKPNRLNGRGEYKNGSNKIFRRIF